MPSYFLCTLLLAILTISQIFTTIATTTPDPDRPLCTKNQHILGKWVVEEEETEEPLTIFTFPCCAADYLVHQYMSEPDQKDCGGVKFETPVFRKDTHPMFGAVYTGSNDHYAHFTTMSCAKQHFEKFHMDHDMLPSTEKNYMWRPDNCALPKFDGLGFCEVLGNRTILMVGDSSMQQSAGTLMSMILASGGKCGEQIVMGSTYYFVYTLKGINAWTHSYDTFLQLSNGLKQVPDICIMNFGAWARDPGDTYDMWMKLLPQLRERAKANSGTKFVWRTTNPPHSLCQSSPSPIVDLPEDEDDLVRDPFQIQKRKKLVNGTKYGWEHFWEYDKQSIEFATNESMPIIDMYPLYFRPDGHVGSPSASQLYDTKYNDCLHYNIPGPLNIFSTLLMNMLVTKEI